MEFLIKIKFGWTLQDGTETPAAVLGELDKIAESEIFANAKNGDTSGDLHAEINGVEYVGEWSRITTENVTGKTGEPYSERELVEFSDYKVKKVLERVSHECNIYDPDLANWKNEKLKS